MDVHGSVVTLNELGCAKLIVFVESWYWYTDLGTHTNQECVGGLSIQQLQRIELLLIMACLVGRL